MENKEVKKVYKNGKLFDFYDKEARQKIEAINEYLVGAAELDETEAPIKSMIESIQNYLTLVTNVIAGKDELTDDDLEGDPIFTELDEIYDKLEAIGEPNFEDDQQQTITLVEQVESLITLVDGLSSSLSESYYTSAEIDTTLQSYYTSSEVDTAIETAISNLQNGATTSNDTLGELETSLGNVYTKAEVDEIIGGLAPAGEYLTEHQDISGKLNTSDLLTAEITYNNETSSLQTLISSLYNRIALLEKVNSEYSFTSYDAITDAEYATGTVLVKKLDGNYFIVEVLTNDIEGFVGNKYKISTSATPGNEKYTLYTNESTPAETGLKVVISEIVE